MLDAATTQQTSTSTPQGPDGEKSELLDSGQKVKAFSGSAVTQYRSVENLLQRAAISYTRHLPVSLQRYILSRLPSFMIRNHLAQRPDREWANILNYGDSDSWNREFEKTVLSGIQIIQNQNFKPEELTDFCAKRRGEIAQKRNLKIHEFGEERKHDSSDLAVTHVPDRPYQYAMKQVLNIKPDGRTYVELDNYEDSKSHGMIVRETRGFIDNTPVPLHKLAIWTKPWESSFIWDRHCTRVRERLTSLNLKEYAIWRSPGGDQIPVVMPHIHRLIQKAVDGDLSKIPEIHWWYVQLAPVRRGPGGIAEMITNAICRFHGVDLPPWKEGVAPSVEVLLQPDMEVFCRKYHTLFATDQTQLKQTFQPR